MSINVTVKSNPIHISENMSSAVSNETESEIKKRRQIRLQQVRQQSKDIAQNIRNKVKKEHDKQITQASNDNTTKLKQWQNRKLLQLKSQYQEGLNEIGLGHIQAANEEKIEDKAVIEQEKRRRDAKDRGFQASQKLQIKKNEQNMRKALPAQHKKFAREVENTRASMVSKIKSPEKIPEQRKHTDMANDNFAAVNLELSDDAKLTDSTDETPTSDTESHSAEDSVIITATIRSPRKHKSRDIPPDDLLMKTAPQKLKSSVQDAFTNPLRAPKKLDIDPTGATEACIRQIFLDTRISDRIKSRLLPFPDSEKLICGSSYASDYAPAKFVCCPCSDRKIENTGSFDTDKLHIVDTRDNVTSKSTLSKSASDKMTMRSIRSQPKSLQSTKQKDRNATSTLTQLDQATKVATEKVRGIEVPLKPPVALISSNETLSHLHSLAPQPTNISKVQYYDHRNRYNTEYLTSNSNIQKITNENLIQLADPDSLLNDTELMRRRDREAQQRGQKALEKERIHKEYNELLQKLPILQKQERIACLCRDKPTFHMNKERLQEVENKRQNVMENAYENLFTNIVTLSPKLKVTPDPNNMPFVTIHNPDSTTIRSKTEIKVNEPQIGLDENQTNLLQILLQNLQQQKEMLQQLGSLPAEQNLQNIVDTATEGKKSSTGSIQKSLSPCECVSVKPLILQNISTQTSPAQTSRTSTKVVVSSSPKRPYRSMSNDIDESTSPKKAKKIRNRVLSDTALANNANLTRGSTKNTPVPVKKDAVTPSSDNTDSSIPVKISKPSHIKHKCDCKPQIGCDQLCEIRIRIQENEKPEIIISSPKIVRSTRTDSKGTPSKPLLKVPSSHSDPASTTALKASSQDERKRSKTQKSSPKRVAVNKPTTWGEHFTQNSSSSSTVYYSPPTMQHANSIKTKAQKDSTKSKSTTDSSAVSKKQIDRRLMTYISKLLDLSKAQIDELNVSNVSDITTPGNSVMECSSNRPMKQLMNVMKLFKLSPLDIATNLNYSKNSSPAVTINSNSTIDTPGDLDPSKSLQIETAKNRLYYSDTSGSSRFGSDTSKTTNESGGFVKKYAEMADVCHRRISDLTAEIEKIRKEKQQILESHSESDKENSTVYRNLPSDLGQTSYQTISPHSIVEQEELNEKLLRIHSPRVLRIHSPREFGPVAVDVNYEEFFQGVDDVDQDIMDRYIKLKTDVNKLIVDIPDAFEASSQILSDIKEYPQTLSTQFEEPKQLKNQIIQNTNNFRIDGKEIGRKGVIFSVDNPDKNTLDLVSNRKSEVNKLIIGIPGLLEKNVKDREIESDTRQDPFFVPLLDDIPRLPKLGTSLISETHPINPGKRPPPSKGLIAARKFKGDIIAAPHELSTIAEADSLISTKINLKQIPVACTAEDYKSNEKHIETYSSHGSNSSSSSSSGESLPDLLAELIGKVNVADDFKGDITKRSETDTSTEKSDLETIETMLRSIGMDWAISTLRKTRETLGRNSSSSSTTELTNNLLDCKNNDLTPISGVESSNITEVNSTRSCCSSFGKDIDLSQISGGSLKSIDKCNRTSTPIQTTKKRCNSKNKGNTFTGESDQSSAPKNTDDQYLTVPDVSLKSHNRTE